MCNASNFIKKFIVKCSYILNMQKQVFKNTYVNTKFLQVSCLTVKI